MLWDVICDILCCEWKSFFFDENIMWDKLFPFYLCTFMYFQRDMIYTLKLFISPSFSYFEENNFLIWSHFLLCYVCYMLKRCKNLFDGSCYFQTQRFSLCNLKNTISRFSQFPFGHLGDILKASILLLSLVGNVSCSLGFWFMFFLFYGSNFNTANALH